MKTYVEHLRFKKKKRNERKEKKPLHPLSTVKIKKTKAIFWDDARSKWEGSLLTFLGNGSLSVVGETNKHTNKEEFCFSGTSKSQTLTAFHCLRDILLLSKAVESAVFRHLPKWKTLSNPQVGGAAHHVPEKSGHTNGKGLTLISGIQHRLHHRL